MGNEIIQSMWVGPRLSVMEQLSIRSYLQNGHKFHLYAYHPVENVPEGAEIKDANEIVPEAKIWTYSNPGFGHQSYAGFADVFRYRLLFKKGNWWVDTDSICLKPFDFPEVMVFSSETGGPNCGNLKAQPGTKIYEWLVQQTETVNPAMGWGFIGPRLIRQAIARFGHQNLVKPWEMFCCVPYDALARTMTEPDPTWQAPLQSYAAHLWNEAWRSAKINKDAVYHPDSIYEKLKARYGLKNVYPYVPKTPPQPVNRRHPTAHLPLGRERW
jgi:hypothetical protein